MCLFLHSLIDTSGGCMKVVYPLANSEHHPAFVLQYPYAMLAFVCLELFSLMPNNEELFEFCT